MSHTLTGLGKTTNHQLLLSLDAEASSLCLLHSFLSASLVCRRRQQDAER